MSNPGYKGLYSWFASGCGQKGLHTSDTTITVSVPWCNVASDFESCIDIDSALMLKARLNPLVLDVEDGFSIPLSPPKGLWQTFTVHLNLLSSS